MKISRSRTHRVNLGRGTYEFVEFGASVEVDADELDRDIDPIAYLNMKLDELLEDDMNEAIANVPEGEATHAETWRR